ncbi:phosphatase PAP2 family protein [Agitococcus lubricus]|uniref:Membrane-associated PAP2 superfamily phosphatase n=1 Tax=Agitococcus lubricus TaxID=1077255 RepID=A0A2T5IWA4_9GAMM|nr:phosphatase PAP2 family protein [Agitococcus lubricus]PTQ88171.1 membrane-associated PAP2 superfamily phosphatase [Agitococcus lubricus]
MPFSLHKALIIPLFISTLVGLLFLLTPLDFMVGDFFFRYGEFIGRDSWWADRLIHKGGGKLIFTIALASLLMAIASLKIPHLRPYRQVALYILLCIALGTGLVNLLKHITNMDCPWDLTRYGGHVTFYGLWRDKPEYLGISQCFPGGHSSGAFSLFSLYFVCLHYKPRWASSILTVVISLGTLFGLGQWARGAHFPSHDFSSAIICWYVCLALYFPFHKALTGLARLSPSRDETTLHLKSLEP